MRTAWAMAMGAGIAVIMMLAMVYGCAAENRGHGMKVGGPCTYKEIPGTARIVSIEPARPDSFNCPHDPVKVRFDFSPDDTTLASKHAAGRTLTVGAGMNPSRQYVEAKGIRIGGIYKCIRHEIASGTCTPVLFDFPGIDLSDYADSCFARGAGTP